MKTSKIYEIYEIDDYGKKRIAVSLTSETAVEYVKANLTYDSDSESAVDRTTNNKWVSSETALNCEDITKYTLYHDKHSWSGCYLDGFEVNEIEVLP